MNIFTADNWWGYISPVPPVHRSSLIYGLVIDCKTEQLDPFCQEEPRFLDWIVA